MPETTPFDKIKNNLPKNIHHLLPKKWEKIGNTLLLKLQPDLCNRELIAKEYASVLGASSVLEDLGVSGRLRTPITKVLWGGSSETIHKENGVLFKLDPAKVMFSSGNVDERIRMATVSENKEVVADLFAGIGYFTIPMAFHSRPSKIWAAELNPVAHSYLKENCALNDVENIVTPLLGDNREVLPEGIADRVILGYVGTTHEYLEKAFRVLKPQGGIMHYHETCPNSLLPDRPASRVKDAAIKANRKVKVVRHYKVKSYSPGVSHIALDVEVDLNYSQERNV